MISLGNVTFQYAGCEEGVRNIDLTIRDGECVVLTGPSGGGKTTLTRLINGLAPAYYPGKLTGSLRLDETELTKLAHRAGNRKRVSGPEKPVFLLRTGGRGCLCLRELRYVHGRNTAAHR